MFSTYPNVHGSRKCRFGQANTNIKIVGGAPTEENEYPWQIDLLNLSVEELL